MLKREVFDRFLHGLLVVGSGGEILCSNEAAGQMLDALKGRPGGSTCCALLGCEEEQEGCLTARAPISDIRREVCTSAGVRTLWVSAFPLDEEAGQVLVQLRHGDPHDRRRQVNPDWRASSRLRVQTLGATAVETNGASLDGEWLDTRVGTLFRYLIVRRPRPVTADEIGESLWRDADYTITRSVRTCVHRLRQQIEPYRPSYEPPEYLLTRGGSYLLNHQRLDIDADKFEREVTDGLGQPDGRTAAASLERGLALYSGEFLADAPFADWALSERRRLHDIACCALRALADFQLRAEHRDGARTSLARLAELQPLDEAVARQLIELEIATGRGSDAKRRFDQLARQMRETLGSAPTFTLGELAS